MRIAIVGSRELTVNNLGDYVAGADEIVTGGAVGIDRCAADYARNNGIKLTEFLPEYSIYGRAAPIVRNKQIVDYADKVVAIWNEKSKGTLSVIKYAQKMGKECEIIRMK